MSAAPSGAAPLDSHAAWVKASRWAGDAQQIEDPARLRAALEELAAALHAPDPVLVYAGLLALPRLWNVDFDRDGCRPTVLSCLSSDRWELRQAAVAALASLRGGARDVEALLPLAVDKSPAVRISFRGRDVAEIRPLAPEPTPEERVADLTARGLLSGGGGRPGKLATVARRPGALARFLAERE